MKLSDKLIITELRIGNLVLDSTKNTTKIETIIPERNRIVYGIFITPNRLIEIGFKKELNVAKTNFLYIHGFLSLADRDGYWTCATHNLITHPLPVKLKYIHELQNLNFALKNIEFRNL